MVDILKADGWNLMGIAHYAIRLVLIYILLYLTYKNDGYISNLASGHPPIPFDTLVTGMPAVA